MKKNLFVSFSGGLTSAYMTYRLLNDWRGMFNEVVVIFANTGQEREETLKFVHDCDNNFNFKTVWLEAVVNQKNGVGTKHRVVNFDSASRNGEPFEDTIKAYGIPNKSYPICTRELKLAPMYSYIKSLGWGKGDYNVAIGIRSDESRRIAKGREEKGIIYPFIDIELIDKQDVNSWWSSQEFGLHLEEHQGNCSWCWKKSLKKHMLLISEDRSIFDFPKEMEKKYCTVKAPYGDRVFFRGNRSTEDLIRLYDALNDGEPAHTSKQQALDFDKDSGCSESCEAFDTVDKKVML